MKQHELPGVGANVAEALAGLRREVALTQAEVAERAECSLAMVGLLEGGWLPKRRSTVLPRVESVLVERIGEWLDELQGEANG